MANRENLAMLRQGVEAWNAWRERNPLEPIDLCEAELHSAYLALANLSSANLSGAILKEAILSGANLTDALLSGSNLENADLGYADVSNADLRNANLGGGGFSGTNFTNANLTSADFSIARLFRANLNNAKLTNADLSRAMLASVQLDGADLSCASLGSTIFADVDLSRTAGLTSVRHHRPSTIGVDTILRSKGEIPASFLRGAGVSDGFIAYAKSLVGAAIQFHSLFISYAGLDQEFAGRLYSDLQAKGVRCWFAPHDVRGGRKLHEQIDEAIQLHDRLLLILSPHSMASHWVMTEISKARRRESRDGVRILFPISLAPFDAIRDWECFDADTGKDSAREIREYFIPDFSNWKDHDAYQKAFGRLLKDLQAPQNSDGV
jgi:hypothetical protein